MMKQMLLLFLIWAVSLSKGFAEETIRISTGEFPPFLSKHLKHNGAGLRIIREAFALKGVKVEYGFFPWKRAYLYVKDGKWDASATWARKTERDKYLYFSDPLYQSTYAFFHLKDYQFDWNTLDDLEGINIGATGSYTYTPEFYQAIEEGRLKVEFVSSDEQNFKKLLAGRIKIFPSNIDVGYDLLAKKFSMQEIESIVHHRKPFLSVPTHLVFSKRVKKNKRLLALFNQGLKQLRDSGKVDQYFEESRKGDYIIWKKPVRSVENLNLITALEPPQQYLEDGKLQGIGIDVINAIQNEIGSSYKISHFPWARGMKNAKINKNSIMFLAAKTLDREPHFIFLGPILAKKYYLYKRSTDNLMIESLEAARNVESIASVQSDVRTKYLINQKFSNIHLLGNHQQGLLMLTRGRVDLWASSDWELSSQLKAADIPFSQVIPAYELFKKYNYIIINNQTNPKTISNWKKALRKIKDDGTMDNIAAKWSKKLNLNLHFSKKSDAIEIKLE